MYIVRHAEPRNKLKGGDLVVIDNRPYFVIEYPIVALLDATNCNALADGKYDSIEELNECIYNQFENLEIFSKEEYHFKLERR